jgi:hypothetical protein
MVDSHAQATWICCGMKTSERAGQVLYWGADHAENPRVMRAKIPYPYPLHDGDTNGKRARDYISYGRLRPETGAVNCCSNPGMWG